MTDNEKLYDKVEQIIAKEIRPFIEADCGMIDLREVKENIVYVHLSGACAGCPGAAMTLKGGVERILQMKLPSVRSVELAM